MTAPARTSAPDSDPRQQPLRPWLRRLGRLLVTGVALFLCWLLLRHMHPRKVLDVLRHARWSLVTLAVVLNLTLNLLARTLRWWALLEPMPVAPHGDGPGGSGESGAKVTPWELALLLCASFAANNLLPARAGEALRTVYLQRRYGYPAGSVIAGQLLEKIMEALSLGLLGLAVALFAHPPAAFRFPLLAFAVVGPAGLVLCLAVGKRMARSRPESPQDVGSLHPQDLKRKRRSEEQPSANQRHKSSGAPPQDPKRMRGSEDQRPEREPGGAVAKPSAPVQRWTWPALRARLRHFAYRLGEAMDLMSSPRVWARSLFWSAVSDLTDVFMAGLCLHAVGVELSLAAWFLVFLVINLAIAIPSTPGQVGVLEAGAVLVLRALGVADSPALAFALLYHAAHVVPMTLVGMVALRFAPPVSSLQAPESPESNRL